MARIQNHHISYTPEWNVELTRQMHSCIGSIQNTKATIEQYARVSNFLHALVAEWNRLRMELDIGGDYRIVKAGKQPIIKRTKRRRNNETRRHKSRQTAKDNS